MHKSLSLFLSLLAAAAFGAGAGKSNDFDGRRALIIGIDGCRADALRAAMEQGRAPNLKRLADEGVAVWDAYAGGELGQPTQQPTKSGPGWSTVLTGVWTDQHGVSDNSFAGQKFAQAPHFLRRLKELRPASSASSLCSWPAINPNIVTLSEVNAQPFVDLKFQAVFDKTNAEPDWIERDRSVRDRTVQHLREDNPDVVFVHFDQVDEAGHDAAKTGSRFAPDDPQYLASISTVDGYVGELLAALRQRPRFAEERWLILATTEHGGRGNNHGGQSAEERGIWLIAHGAGVRRANEGRPISHAAVPPTVFAWLGVPVSPEWKWVEPSFISSP
ncbi:MAG: hypothetical protein QOE70_4678 [Chthoniobacter sp.]|jgi:arylsulfatase A-like enzyme|nr:hypothetical protein [Chthoniobacter sp.]